MTPGQYNKIKDHPNLAWLKNKAVTQNQAVDQSTIKLKITEAINSQLPGMATDANIREVAQRIGVHYGNVHKPALPATGRVHNDAVDELRGTDKALADAVRMVFNKTADGRTSPGGSNQHIRHLHVPGTAHLNLLFDINTHTVLGLVHEHMQGGLGNEQRNVMNRVGGATTIMNVLGDTIS